MTPIQIYRVPFSEMEPQSLTHILDKQTGKFQVQMSFFPHFSEAVSFWPFWPFGLKGESGQFSYPVLSFQTLLRKLWMETHGVDTVPQTALEQLHLFSVPQWISRCLTSDSTESHVHNWFPGLWIGTHM